MVSKLSSIDPAETSVLIVDDSTQYSDVLRRILKGVFGYTEIVSVDNTKEAFDRISAEPEKFRLMFVDFNFPGTEKGTDLLMRLKEASLMDERIAFLITSEPTLENVRSATSYGALGVLAKPFDREELKTQMEKARIHIRTENCESF